MNVYMIGITVLFSLVAIEAALRLFFNYQRRGMRGVKLLKNTFWFYHDIPHRFSNQANFMGIEIDELHDIMAKASWTDRKTIEKVYTGKKAFEQYAYRPFLGFAFKPNQSLSYTEINELGFQGNFRSFRKPPNTKRVLILGGSAAFGIGCTSKEHNWTFRLQNILNDFEQESNSKIGWEVINLAFVASQSLSDYMIFKMYAPLLSPDYVIHFAGFNDLYFFLNEKKLYTFNFYQQVIDAIDLSRLFSLFRENIFLFRLFLKVISKITGKRKALQLNEQIYTVW